MLAVSGVPAWWPTLLAVVVTGLSVYTLCQLGGFRELLREAGARVALLADTLRCLPHLPRRRRWFLHQLYQAGVLNLHVIALVGLFIGMIISLQTGIELARFGQQDQIGPLVAAGMAREMGPFITAIILASTHGSALAAEMGTMSVSDELTALEVMSIDRTSLLILPRVAALAVICPLLTVVTDMIGILGGGFVANAQLGVGWNLYLDSAFAALSGLGQTVPLPKDVYTGLFKAFCFGVLIAVVSCQSGSEARGGALGVGRATSRAVRDSAIGVIVANYFLTWVFYGGAP